MDVPNLRTWQPDSGDAKNVDDTKMLNTQGSDSVDMNQANVVGKELINKDKISGPLGATGRN